MAKINQLPEEVANQISAGEVVERPASVVKELVENSIDAESDKIRVEVEQGGKERIRVKDNGHGINKDDIELAFSRYATSKIKSVNDIYSLKSLGFRGEALASISAVSRLKALSRAEGAVSGTKITVKGGKILNKETIGCPQGTDITVDSLFYNTPARYKYMKTTSTEFSHISRIITAEALPYSNIQFKLTHNGREILKTPGTGKLKDAIYALYGRELTEKLIPLNYEDQYIKIKGYVAHPSFSRSSRIHELFFVNKRSVANTILSKGVESGYQGFIEKGKYPIVFLFIELNPILVDVNVHPTKKRVEFSRKKIIKEVIKKGVRSVLKNEQLAVSHKFKKQKNENKTKRQENIEDQKMQFDLSSNNEGLSVREDSTINNKNLEEKGISIGNKDKKDNNNDKILYSKNNKSHNNYNKSPINENSPDLNTESTGNGLKINKILGQLFGTYILTTGQDGLYIIDQHNAHERILFDKYYEKYSQDSPQSQKLLTPVKIELTATERELVNKYADNLTELGFELEEFGGSSFLIRQVPYLIVERNVKVVLKEILDRLIEEKNVGNKADLITEIIKYMACRGAVKAEKKLAEKEMKSIIENLFQTNNPYRCPHGRPIILHLSKEELDKGVGRI